MLRMWLWLVGFGLPREERGRELGIRMAMGAEAGAVQRLVLGQGLRVAAIGLVVGIVGE